MKKKKKRKINLNLKKNEDIFTKIERSGEASFNKTEEDLLAEKNKAPV